MKALVTTYISETHLKQLEKMFEVVETAGMMDIGRVLNEEEMIDKLNGVDVLFVEFDPVTKKVLESAKSLKLIASVRGGAHANIDVKAASELGIPISFVPGRNQDTVADFTIGLIIALSRGIAKGHYLIKSKQITDESTYDKNGFCVTDVNWVGSTPEKFAYLQFKGPTLSGKTIGLVGLGAIARETAKRAIAFNMTVIAYDPYVNSNSLDFQVEMVSLEELMSRADFVSIHLPVTNETRGLVSSDLLSRMKKTAYLINTARAAVLDYDQLIKMLKNDEIAGAALDVYPTEPLNDSHELLDLPNVVLTPHIAGCSLDPYDRSYEFLFADVKDFFTEGKLTRLYNPEYKH